MAKCRWYVGYKLFIRSEIAVPGACPVDESAMLPLVPDIEIAIGRAQSPSDAAVLGLFARSGDSIFFDVPNVARFLCRAGKHVAIEPWDGASEQDIASCLVATALPVLLWMRPREVVLHGAGVMLPDKRGAIAVCGVSGSGKSTVLRALLERGVRIIGDDTLRVTFGGVLPEISGLPARYCWDEKPGRRRVGHPVPPSLSMANAPLATIFVLELPRPSSGFSMRRLTAANALQAVMKQRHRPRVPRLVKREDADLPLMVELARLKIWSWHRGENQLSLSDEEWERFCDPEKCQNVEIHA